MVRAFCLTGLAVGATVAGLAGIAGVPMHDGAAVARSAAHSVVRTDAEPTAFETVSSMIGRVHRLTGYVRSIAADANDLSQEEIAVSKQYRCLAQAVYFEARGEPDAGKHAVAHVVLNRLRDDRYPNTICGVVFQNQHLRHRCQFSFACDGLSDTPRETQAWHRSLQVALEALTGASEDITQASTHFHTRYVEPVWASQLKPTVQVGAHLFYQEPPREELSLTLSNPE